MGVDVERGILRIGTPLVVYDKDVIYLKLENDKYRKSNINRS